MANETPRIWCLANLAEGHVIASHRGECSARQISTVGIVHVRAPTTRSATRIDAAPRRNPHVCEVSRRGCRRGASSVLPRNMAWLRGYWRNWWGCWRGWLAWCLVKTRRVSGIVLVLIDGVDACSRVSDQPVPHFLLVVIAMALAAGLWHPRVSGVCELSLVLVVFPRLHSCPEHAQGERSRSTDGSVRTT